MTLLSIAYKNIKGNLNKYVMYCLSNTLVVMVFFIFANFINNPQVKSVDIMGSVGVMASKIVILCEVIIIIFSMVFATYSITNFLKSREKEFGLLSMFGLTKGQIRSYVILENLIISAVSVSAGVLLGIVFSKLFFMAVTVILALDAEISFVVSNAAITITLLTFIILFQGISFIVSYKIKNNNIVELLKGDRTPKSVPKFSKAKAMLSIILIVLGYIIALYSGVAIVFTMFPILILVVSGTYILYSQFSVFFTYKLQRNKRIYYKGINIITLSQIIYKLEDSAKVLFIASILSAVTLTASVSVYSVQKTILGNIDQSFPQDLNIIERGLDSENTVSHEKIEETIKSYGHELQHKNKIILIEATNEESDISNKTNNKRDFYIMSNSDYNVMASQFGRKQVQLQDGEVLIHTYNIMGSMGSKYFIDDKEYITLTINNENLKLKIKDEISGGIINDDKNTNTAVVSDDVFNKVFKNSSDEKKIVYYGYNIKDWKNASDAVEQIKIMFPSNDKNSFSERVVKYLPIIRSMSLVLFIGTFISIIFFVSTSSILYFKIFSEIQKDRHEFIALKKIGVSNDEIKRVVSTQCSIMFLLPFVVSLSHSIFAIKSLSNLLGDNLSGYFIVISLIYLVLQLLYLVFARNMYNKQINTWMK
ncbi:FtsX-like permease family protein [Clostridium bovifaecis]|uniref:FtsX-like permease family protein n=1 Tax=Clostridium bovifaecis TaxID=2184719 RepID=A0A6I6F427_9CLOT|nr:FtsX-like permease family protein [Clostridium bovifaecis]